jgi:hypothetical protein
MGGGRGPCDLRECDCVADAVERQVRPTARFLNGGVRGCSEEAKRYFVAREEKRQEKFDGGARPRQRRYRIIDPPRCQLELLARRCRLIPLDQIVRGGGTRRGFSMLRPRCCRFLRHSPTLDRATARGIRCFPMRHARFWPARSYLSHALAQFGPGVDAQLVVDAGKVGFDCLGADEQSRGHFPVRHAGRG